MAELPIVQYEFFETSELVFSSRVRYVCETECPQYGKSWACPPGVGGVEACRERCQRYPHALLITSMTEVSDMENMEELLSTRKEHEELTRRIKDLFIKQHQELLVLSTESCALCEDCTWPDAPCRFPQRMLPCMEGYGILVTGLAERCGITFLNGNNLVTWFSLILYREALEEPGTGKS